MKKIFVALAATLFLGLVAREASAAGCTSPFCYGTAPNQGLSPWLHKQPLPAFQAAPWYLYWPYDGHFQTPAPLNGAYYAPPSAGPGGFVNPYFPQGGNPYAIPSYGR